MKNIGAKSVLKQKEVFVKVVWVVVCIMICVALASCGGNNKEITDETTELHTESTTIEVNSTTTTSNVTSSVPPQQSDTEQQTERTNTRISGEEPSEEEKLELIKIAEGFFDNLVNGEFGECEKLFDATMKAELPEDELIVAWSSVAMKVGIFNSIVKTDYVYREGYDIILITSDHTSGGVVSTIVFSLDWEIAGLFFRDIEKPNVSGDGDQNAASQQAAVVPGTVIEEDVTIIGDPRYPLSGKLTLPKEQGSGALLSAVVLVHGSGPQDMDETIGANKPFRDIAWALAEEGIAVLRYDKRTYSYGGTMNDMYGTSLTVKEEVIDDAKLAKELLIADDRINSEAILVAGHSLGGMLAPRIMDECGFAGAIIMAGSPRSLIDIVLDQINYTISNGDYDEVHIILQHDVNETQYEAYLGLNDETDEDSKDTLIFGMNGYYLKEMERYKTSNYFNSINKPILILQGTSDFQVSYENDFKEYQKLAEGRDNIEFKAYEGLNHLFIESVMEKPDASEYLIPGTVDDAVTEDIASWIRRNF